MKTYSNDIPAKQIVDKTLDETVEIKEKLDALVKEHDATQKSIMTNRDVLYGVILVTLINTVVSFGALGYTVGLFK